MTVAATKLPPNPIRHFYRGGPAIAALRGIDVGGDHSPEEWVGSATTLFGETERGLSRLAGRRPSATGARPPTPRRGSAPTTRRASARAPRCWSSCSTPASASRSTTTPTCPSPASTSAWTSARPRRGSCSPQGDGAQVAVGWRADVAADTLRGWVDAQDHDALLGALNPLPVSAGDTVFVPAGVPHAIGDGILIAELQEPTDLSVLLEWDGFGIADEHAATLGLGWDVALGSVQRDARDPAPLRGPHPDGTVAQAAARGGRRLLHRSARRAGRRFRGAARRLRGRPRHRGLGVVRRPRREPRRRAARYPMLRGPSPSTATSWRSSLAPHGWKSIGRMPSVVLRTRGRMPRGGDTLTDPLLLGIDVGTSACKAAVVDAQGRELALGQTPTPWESVPTGAELDAEALLRAVVEAAREAIDRAPEGAVAGIGVTSVAETGMLLDDGGRVIHRPVAWHDARGAAEAQALARDLPDFTERTGLPATALCSLAKLEHLGTDGAARWLNVGEWIVHRLGGRQVSELSLSSRTGLLDLEPAAPYDDALAWARLPDDLMAEVVVAGADCGRSDGAALPGTDGAVLTVAGHDHLVAGVGVGVIAPGDVLDSCGTAEALVRVAAPQDAAARRRSAQAGVTVGWHVTEGRQALLAGVWSGLALREVL